MKYIFLIFVTMLFQISSIEANEGAPDNCGGLFTKLDEFSELKKDEFVWGTYTCKSCKTDKVTTKPGADGKQACPNCGSPHTDEDYVVDGIVKDSKGKNHISKKADSKVVSDKNDEILAGSGKKWTCGFCSISNFQTDPRCRGCGGDKEEGKKLVLTAEKPKTKYKNGVPGGPGGPPQKENKLPVGKIAAATGVAAVAGGTYWALSTKELEAKVTNLSWMHTSTIERFTRIKKSGFKVDVREVSPIMPVNGKGERAGAHNFTNCQSKYYGESPKYPCGTESVQESYTERVRDGDDCNMVDQGNGSFKNVCTPKYKNVTKYRTVTQTKYCTDPVYEKFCDYETYVWKQIDQRSTSGGEAKSGRLPWPEIRLETLDREIRQESYSAVLSYPHKDKTETSKIDINTESEFMTWKMNEKIKVFRRNAGGLAKWERAQ